MHNFYNYNTVFRCVHIDWSLGGSPQATIHQYHNVNMCLFNPNGASIAFNRYSPAVGSPAGDSASPQRGTVLVTFITRMIHTRFFSADMMDRSCQKEPPLARCIYIEESILNLDLRYLYYSILSIRFFACKNKGIAL
ncbi:hypothetical protein ACJX0J_015372 [Zea mays]